MIHLFHVKVKEKELLKNQTCKTKKITCNKIIIGAEVTSVVIIAGVLLAFLYSDSDLK